MKTWLLSILLLLSAACAAKAEVRSDELEAQLDRYLERVVAAAAADQRPAIDIFREVRDAMGAGSYDLAVRDLEVLAGRGDGAGEGGFGTWLRLGLALQKKAGRIDGLPPGEAMVAAYRAYGLARDDGERLQALLLLGDLIAQGATEDGSHNRVYAIDPKTAYAVYAEIGALAGSASPFADEEAALAELPFRLERIVFPLPPGTQDLPIGMVCEGTWDDYSYADELDQGGFDAMDWGGGEAAGDDAAIVVPGGDAAIVIPGDDQRPPADAPFYQRRCSRTETRYTCLVFSAAVATDPAAIAAGLTVRRSERLPGQLAFGPAEPQPVADLPLRAADKRICFGDLRFGARYQFELAPGLAAADGRTLGEPVVARLQMPDRTPSLGFNRGAYVLPAGSDRDIVLRAVNVRQAGIMIRRLGDLQLIREVVRQNLVNQLTDDDACFILRNVGEVVADGNVLLGGTPNEEVHEVLPFGRILAARSEWLAGPDGSRRPGSYSWARGAFTFPADPAAAAVPAPGAGVYALFGSLTGLPLPDTDAVAEDEESGEPAAPACGGFASQWLVVTNIGLTLQKSGSEIVAVARALDTGAALEGVRVELVARSGQVLAEAVTGPLGATPPIDARLGRGRGGNELVAVMAYQGGDFTFLDAKADSVSLVDRGFEGRTVAAEYDAFIAPSRGIFRPGDTVDALILVRAPDGGGLAEMPPVEIALRDQRGRLVGAPDAAAVAGDEAGAFLVELALPDALPEGTLTIEVRAFDQLIGSRPIEVRYYQPDTVGLAFDEASWSGTLTADGTLAVSGAVDAHYLYALADVAGGGLDAPAANLAAHVDVSVSPAKSPLAACYEDFTFGRSASAFLPVLLRGLPLRSDDAGRIAVDLTRAGLPPADVPLQAAVAVSVVDANGRAEERRLAFPLRHVGRHWIGLRQVDDPGRRLSDPLAVEVVVLDEERRPVRGGVAVWQLYRQEDAVVWQNDGTSWQFAAAAGPRQAVGSAMRLPLAPPAGEDADGCPAPQRLELPPGPAGSYRLEMRFADAVTELAVGSGWSTAPDGRIQPDALAVRADAREFRPDEPLGLTLTGVPYPAGRALVQIVSRGSILASADVALAGTGDTRLSVPPPAGGAWPPGDLHAYVTAFRAAGADNSVQRGPARAIGGVRIHIGDDAAPVSVRIAGLGGPYSHADIEAAAPGAEPGLTFTVETEGFAGEAYVAVAAVDEGILALTDFATPDPRAHYLDGMRLDLEVYDTYGRILYGNYGAGESALREIRGASYRNADVAVVPFRAILRTSGGRATFTLPAASFPASFMGRVRVMAYAWDERSVAAAAERQIVIRDPVSARLAMPAFLAPGDEALLPLTVANLDNLVVDRAAVEISLGGPVGFGGAAAGGEASPCITGEPADVCRRFVLPAERGATAPPLLVPLAARPDGDGGTGSIALTLQPLRKGSDEAVATLQSLHEIPVRTPGTVVTRVSGATSTIAPGQRLAIGEGEAATIAEGRFVPGSFTVATRLSRHGLQAEPASIAGAVDTVRRLDEIAGEAQLLIATAAADPGGREAMLGRLNTLVREIGLMQTADGGFTGDLQAQANRDQSLTEEPGIAETAFALDLLQRARAAGAAVEDSVIDHATGALLSRLQRDAAWGLESCGRGHLYAAVVLAGSGRLFADTLDQVSRFCADLIAADPASKLMLAAAFNAFGLDGQADATLAGLDLEAIAAQADAGESAAVAQAVALYLESGRDAAEAAPLLRAATGSAGVAGDGATGSWLARANDAVLSLLEEQAPRPFAPEDVACQPEGAARPFFDGVDLAPVTPGEGLVCTNRGEAPLYASFLVSGTPSGLDAAHAEGIDVRLSVVGAEVEADGTWVMEQYRPAYVFLDIVPTAPNPAPERLAAVQMLPAGFQVVDRFYKSSWQSVIGAAGDGAGMSWIDYAEASDDRWTALPVPVSGPNVQANYRIAFSLRPTLQGSFAMPPLTVRDLANPRRTAWLAPHRVVVRAPAQ